MKINYKTTALGLIDDPDNFDFGFADPHITPKFTPEELHKFGNSIINGSKHLKDLCGGNIQYVSTSFFEAFKKAGHKIKQLAYQEEIEDSGILITGGFTNGLTHVHTIYYAVVTKYDGNGKMFYNVMFADFSRHSKADSCCLDVYTSITLDDKVPDEAVTRSLIWNGYIEEGRDATYWQSFIILFCLFKKYCDIETKIVEPKNRRAKVAGQKYLNETDKRIQILDCTWFTNLVVSGAFGVSGHLRWQRCGPGLNEKKLIWIDEYQKEGYERKAKILIQNNNNDKA